MADTSLFGRLRRLFASDIVIRNVGGDELKVADVNQIQTTGRYETNSLVDRFTRLYLYNNKNILVTYLKLSEKIVNQERLVLAGEIAGTVAHELNTPLGAIVAGSEGMKENIELLFSKLLLNIRILRLSYKEMMLYEGSVCCDAAKRKPELEYYICHTKVCEKGQALKLKSKVCSLLATIRQIIRQSWSLDIISEFVRPQE